jgi:hypothetical protein
VPKVSVANKKSFSHLIASTQYTCSS